MVKRFYLNVVGYKLGSKANLNGAQANGFYLNVVGYKLV